MPFLLMTLATALVVGYMVWRSYQLQVQAAEERQRQASAQAALQIAGYVGRFHEQLADIARGLIYVGAAPDQQRAWLERMQLVHRHFYDLAVTDATGQEVARTIYLVPEYRTGVLRSHAGTPAVTTALNGQFYLGRVYISDQYGGAPFVQMAVPVYDAAGGITGVLIAEVDLSQLWDVVRKVEAGQGGYVYVVDEEGRLIAYRESEMVQGPIQILPTLVRPAGYVPEVENYLEHRKESSKVARQERGLECELHHELCAPVLAYHRPIEGTGWGIIVEQPVYRAYAEANNLLTLAIGAVVVAFLILVALGWYIRQGILRPMALLGEGAAALASGQLRRRITIRTGDEIELLAQEFNAMAESLQQSQAQLEAFALEKSQQAEAAQARVREMTRLVESGRAITSLDLENVLDTLASEAARTVKADQCLIYIRDERTGDLVVRGVWGMGETEYAAEPLKWGESAAGRVASEGHELFLTGLPDRRFVPKTPTDRLLSSLLALPLKVDERVVGVLQVATRSGKPNLSPEVKRLIEPFARQASIAYKNAQLYEEERRRAREMKIVAEITRTISTSLDLTTTLNLILQSVRELVPYDESEVNLWDPREQVLRTSSRGGQHTELVAGNVYRLDEGLTGWIACNRRSLLIADIRAETEWHTKVDLEKFPLRAFAGVPLLVGHELIGTLELASYQPGIFNIGHLETLQTIANQAAVAIQNARLYEETRRRAEEMAALREAALELTSQLEPERILPAIVERATALLQGSGGALYRVNHEQQTLTIIVSHNLDRDYTGTVIRFGEGLAGRIAQKRQPMVVNNYREWEGRAAPYADSPFTAVIGVPLIWQDELMGVLDVLAEAEHRPFDEDDLRLITLFAGQASVAMQNASLYEQVMRRIEEMSALHDTAVNIASQLDPEQLLEMIVRRAVELLHARGGSLHRYNPADETARLIVSYNMGRDYRGTVLHKGEGVAGQVLQTGQPLIVNDYQNWAWRSPQFADAGFTAVMGAPLVWQEQMMGVLAVLDDAERRVFNLNDLRLITLFASQAVVSLRNADLFAETRRRMTELRTLADIGRALSATLDVRSLLEVIAEQTARVMYAENLYIALYYPDQEEIEFALDTRSDMPRSGRRRKLTAGMTEYVIKTRQPLFLRGTHEQVAQHMAERRIEMIGTPAASWIGVPMIIGERVLGVLSVQHYTDPHVYDESQVELLQSIASQAAIALENARLFSETQRRVAELATLTDIGQALSSTLRVDELLQLVYEQTRRVMYAENMFIALYNPALNEVEFAFSRNPEEVLPGTRRSAEVGLVGYIIKNRRSILIRADATEAIRQMGIELVGPPSTSWLGVPMLVGDRVVGVIAVQHYTNPNQYDHSDRVLLETIASQAAIALENARLYQLTDVRLQQRVEELTGLSRISQELNATLDKDVILNLVLNEAVRATQAQYGTIHLLAVGTGELNVSVAYGYEPDVAERIAGVKVRYGVGIIGHVVESGQPALVNDVSQDETYLRILPDTQSELCVPISYAGAVVGAINLESTELAHFTPEHVEYLQALASQAAIAIGNAQRYEEQRQQGLLLRRRAEQLATLFEISQAFRSDRPLEETLDEIAHAIQETIGFDIVIVSVVEGEPSAPETWMQRRVAAAGIPVMQFEQMKAVRQPWSAIENVLRDEFRISQSYYIPAERREVVASLDVYRPVETTEPRHPGRWHPEDMLLIPLRGTQERILGLISVDSPRDETVPTRATIETMEVFANQAAVAIENARLYADLQRRIDELMLFNEVSRSISGKLDLDALLATVADAAAALLHSDRSTIFLLEESEGVFVPRAAHGFELERIAQVRFAPGQGLVGWVVAEKRGQVVPDVTQDPRFVPHEVSTGIRSIVIAPLMVGEEAIGAIAADKFQARGFTETDLVLLSTLGDQAAIAIENARLYEETRRRVRELSLLYETGEAASSTLAMEETLDIALKGVSEGLKFDFVVLSLVDERAGEVRAVRGVGISEYQMQRARRRLEDRDIMADIIRTGKTEVIEGWDERFDRELFEREGHAALVRVFMPLVAHNRNIGLIEAGYHRERRARIAESDIRLLRALADRIAAAIENARLYEETLARTHELAALLDASAALASSLELKDVLNTLADHLAQVVNATGCALSRWDQEAQRVITLTDRFRFSERPTPPAESYALADYPLTAKVLEQRTPVILSVDDPQADPNEVAVLKEMGSTALLMLPLIARDQVFGLIELYHEAPGYRFGEADIRLAQALADQAGVAISNAQLYEEIRHFTQELEQRVAERTEDLQQALGQLTTERDRVETLFRITSELQASLDLDRVLNRALTLVNEHVRATRAMILLIDPQTDRLLCRAALDPDQSIPPGGRPTRFRRTEGLAGWCIRRRKATIVPDVHADPYWMPEEGGVTLSARSALVVPLLVADDVLGALLMTHTDTGHFTEAHLRLVEAAAAQVATAINNAELYRMIRESAERLGQMLRVQQEEASKSQAILEAVADGVMVADRHGQIILFNAAAERILGTPRSTIIGRPTDDFLGLYGAAGAAWLNVLREWTSVTATRLQTPSLEQRLQIEDRHVRVHISPVTMGDEYLGTVSIFRDVTKEVEVDRAKSDFVSTVSHELRTPMTSIKGYADLLLLGAAGQLSDEQRHFMSIIKSNADRLSDLVNDLLNISRIESGRVELDIRPLRLDGLIEQVVASLRGKIEEKGLSISIEVPPDLPAVQGDRDRVIQILFNLISNAYQYTRPGGSIVVRAIPRDTVVQTDVADTGVGIAPEDQPKVFDRFFRSDDSYVQEFAGTGLGLAIVKQLVQMHQGEIWLESQVGVGTTFSFTLPAVTEASG